MSGTRAGLRSGATPARRWPQRRRRARRAPAVLVVLAAAGLALAACGGGQASTGGGSPSASASGAPTGPMVTTATDPGVGTVLVTTRGQSLYESTASCAGACLDVWRPVALPPGTSAQEAGRGVSALSAVSRDGVRQLAYRGHPLYTFTGDTKPGQVNGNGMDSFGGRWRVARVHAAGPAATPRPASPSPGASHPGTTAPGGRDYGDTDHDSDCRPGHGDAEHDHDCGPGSGPGQMTPGYGPGGRGPMGPGHGPGSGPGPMGPGPGHGPR